jgi:hypothetical protein
MIEQFMQHYLNIKEIANNENLSKGAKKMLFLMQNSL